MRADLTRTVSAAALVLFVTYLYSPCEVSFIIAPTEPTVSTGLDELWTAFRFSTFQTIVIPLTWMEPGPERWQNLKVLWDDAVREVLLVAGCIAMSQLPLLSSRRFTMPSRLRWVLASLFLVCVASTVYSQIEFIAMQSPSDHVFQRSGYLRFGAWLSPISFALAGVATILRRNEVA